MRMRYLHDFSLAPWIYQNCISRASIFLRAGTNKQPTSVEVMSLCWGLLDIEQRWGVAIPSGLSFFGFHILFHMLLLSEFFHAIASIGDEF